MKRKRILAVLIIIVIGGLIGGSVGMYMWNKPHVKVEDATAIQVSAADLCRQYAANEAEANKKYLNKALEVNGKVAETSTNQDGGAAVNIEGADAGTQVQCTMRDKAAKVETGKVLTVKGFCSGNTMFGVLLTDCVVK